jgi:membrane protease YdiL (CAAX protease family)
VFFRGFLQQRFVLLLASFLFMLAHVGKKEIRIISFWSIFSRSLSGSLLRLVQKSPGADDRPCSV